MDRVFEEMEFLARSANRGDVLTLVAEAPHDRQALAAETGASQPTLGRILRDFEKRNWVRATEAGYTATATGRLVAAGLTELSESLAAELHLREISEWLPADDLGVDLRRLGEATITTPTQTRPSAPISRVIKLIETAHRVRIFSHAFNEQTLAAVVEWVADGGQFEGVFSAAAIDAVAHETGLRGQLQQLHAADGAAVRIVEGAVPLAVTVADDTVSLLLRDENGRLQAAVDTDDPVVESWATDRHGRYWESARPLAESDLAIDE
jgi:predicted transcriptional regulator